VVLVNEKVSLARKVLVSAFGPIKRLNFATSICVALFTLFPGSFLQAAQAMTNVVTVMELENKVDIQRSGSQKWDPAYAGQLLSFGDRGQTGDRSRATLRMYDLSFARVGENTSFEVEAPPVPRQKATMRLWKGMLYFFSRDKPIEVNIQTPSASAAVRGTEFVVRSEAAGRTELMLLDGEVVLSDKDGQSVNLVNREQGIVEPGKPPYKAAVIDAINLVQWFLYYPAVLDLDELSILPQARKELEETLIAYRRGDLLQALEKYPENREPDTAAERLLHATLLLSVGQVERADAMLNPLIQSDNQDEHSKRLANAILTLVATVQQNPDSSRSDGLGSDTLATECLATSYRLQSQGQLERALAAA